MKQLGIAQYSLMLVLNAALISGCSLGVKGHKDSGGNNGASLVGPQSTWTILNYDVAPGSGIAVQSTASFQLSKVTAGAKVLRTASSTASFNVTGGIDAQP